MTKPVVLQVGPLPVWGEAARVRDCIFASDPVAFAQSSDYLFVTLAASSDTRYIVDRRVIEALGPDGMIINIPRAANIDESALIEAFASGAPGSAALDAFENEPDPDPRFLDLPNVLLLPHQASGTVETRQAMGNLMCDNLTPHFETREFLNEVV